MYYLLMLVMNVLWFSGIEEMPSVTAGYARM